MRHLIALLSFALITPAIAQVPCTPTIANETLAPPIPGVVHAINFYDDGSGSGPHFFAAGSIASLGNIARLTPTGWQPVGGGLDGTVHALEVIDDGSGPNGSTALYAGGTFGVARWNGAAWDSVSTTSVFAIVRYDDGTGPALHVATLAGIVRLSGASAPLVAGISASSPSPGPRGRIHVLDDDGTGPRPPSIFYASARSFTTSTGASQLSPSSVVRYDPLLTEGLPGNPVSSWIKSATVFDDGLTGPAFYISGHRTGTQNCVVRWNPATAAWINVGPSNWLSGDAAYALTPFADGVGPRPRLYAIGSYATVGVSPASNIAAWDGQTWTRIWNRTIGSAQSMNYHFPSRTGTLGEAHVPALLYAGLGTSSSTTFFAIVGCPRCPGDVDLDGQTTVADLFLYLNAWFANQPSSDIGGNGQSAQDILDFLTGWLTPCP